MKTFKAVIDKSGKMETRLIEAENIEKAKMTALRFGKVIKIEKKYGFNFEPALELGDRQIILLRLSAMTGSKIGAGEALSLMEDNFTGQIKRICGRLLKLVENGNNLSESMHIIGSPHFPQSVLALIKAGFAGGNTPEALKNAAKFEHEMDLIKRGGMGEFITGIIGYLFALLITFGTTRYLVPWMNESDLMKMAGENAKMPVFEILAVICEVSMGITGLIFFGLVLLGTLGRKISPISADGLILKVPYYKDLILSRNNYTTLYSLSLLIGSGVPIETALSLSAENAAPGAMKADLDAAVRNTKIGQPWAKAMKHLHATDRATLVSQQDRDSTAKALISLSDQYKSLYASRIATLAPMLKSVAALFLMLSGSVLFGLTIMPILKMAAVGF